MLSPKSPGVDDSPVDKLLVCIRTERGDSAEVQGSLVYSNAFRNSILRY